MTRSLACLVFLTSATPAAAATLTHQFEFEGDLTDSVSGSTDVLVHYPTTKSWTSTTSVDGGYAAWLNESENFELTRTDDFLTGSFSISLWYYSADDNDSGLLFWSETAKMAVYWHETLRYHMTADASVWSVGSSTQGVWTQLTYTADLANRRVTLYQNGLPISSVQTTADWAGTNRITFGGSRDPASTNAPGSGAIGAIDDVRIYTGALTASEVYDLYPRCEDDDDDGLCDNEDPCLGDPLNLDTDQDEVCDTFDVCAGFDDYRNADLDDYPDGCDPCPFDPLDDADADGVCDDVDGCIDEIATGWDLDRDGCIDDTDKDGVTDNLDVCPGGDDLYDPNGDGAPEDCDVCPGDAANDMDGDGLCNVDINGDIVDVCPHDPVGSDDLDGDTVCNSDDVCANGDDLYDVDEDQIADDCDLCPNDAANDADADGVCGDVDLCVGDDGVDSDDDGVPDDCDTLCPLDPTNDADFDGVCGESDACPLDYLDDSDDDGACDSDDICPAADDFADGDGDGTVDCQDTCPADPENDGDGDGLCESDDNCEGVANQDQADADADAIGDACEPDSDGDSVADDDDNCPTVANALQADVDADGVGDTCDADDDNDGVTDGSDRCPATPAGAAVVPSGCSVAQSCPTTATWKNHGAYVVCVTDVSLQLYKGGQITLTERTGLVVTAAQSNVGRNKRDRDSAHDGHGHDSRGGCQDS